MPRLLRWLALALLVIVLDQISKAAILGAFQVGEFRAQTSFFNLVLVFNYGAAFSFLADAGGWQHWFFVILACAISVWLVFMLKQHAAERLLPSAFSLILGGAVGNVIDRLRFGGVVDFLDFHLVGTHFPAFNLADSAITLGVILMLWQQLFLANEDKQA